VTPVDRIALELIEPKDRAAWRRWLERHHATSGSVRLALVKGTSDVRGVRYAEAVEEALCFGWIDSTAGRLDNDRYTVLMTRRKAKSGWSAVNKQRVERLVREGRMAAPGHAAIEAAKADGSWSKLDASHALEVPRDLATALRAFPNAKRHFDAFPPSARRIILQWIDDAKRPETREKRIADTARLAERNVRANQPR
jgi:uncharacterized protein YdeI (YjbR/CyaY-like superfamily)